MESEPGIPEARARTVLRGTVPMPCCRQLLPYCQDADSDFVVDAITFSYKSPDETSNYLSGQLLGNCY
jgi:hypothetical protein